METLKIIDSTLNNITWECPDCGYESDVFITDKPPDQLHCAICNHESGYITWKKVKKKEQ